MKHRFLVNRDAPQRAQGAATIPCAYGLHAVAARLAVAPPQVARLWVRDDASGRAADLAAAAARRGVPVSRLPASALRELCGSDQHQGVVAHVPPFRYGELAAALADPPERVLVLDHIQDPHNFGALLRTAEAAGVGLVLVPKDGAVGVTASVETAAAGAAMRVPIARVVNVARALHRLKEAGYWIVGLAPRATQELYEFQPPQRVALVLGAEAGLRRLVREGCDILLSIPMQGRAESLNVSVAGALAMYELWRRARRPAGR